MKSVNNMCDDCRGLCMITPHIFELAFNHDTYEAHLCSNHAAHQDPDVPQLSGGWIILAKENSRGVLMAQVQENMLW